MATVIVMAIVPISLFLFSLCTFYCLNKTLDHWKSKYGRLEDELEETNERLYEEKQANNVLEEQLKSVTEANSDLAESNLENRSRIDRLSKDLDICNRAILDWKKEHDEVKRQLIRSKEEYVKLDSKWLSTSVDIEGRISQSIETLAKWKEENSRLEGLIRKLRSSLTNLLKESEIECQFNELSEGSINEMNETTHSNYEVGSLPSQTGQLDAGTIPDGLETKRVLPNASAMLGAIG